MKQHISSWPTSWLSRCGPLERVSCLSLMTSLRTSAMAIIVFLFSLCAPVSGSSSWRVFHPHILATLCFIFASAASAAIQGPLIVVRALEGDRVVLPCNIITENQTDSPILVLVYNGFTEKPVYRIDARSSSLSDSKHWSDLGPNARFDLMSSSNGLVLDPVKAENEAEYRCRVDFKASQTRNVRIKLQVVVVPKKVTIVNGTTGMDLNGMIGPYYEGDNVTVTCVAEGGQPRPRVRWYQGDQILDENPEVADGEVTKNTLTLHNLGRQDLFRVLRCQVTNTDLVKPQNVTVTLDMNIPPVEVMITGEKSFMIEGEIYSLLCEARGSRPPAQITWWMDSEKLLNTRAEVRKDGSLSSSMLTLRPTRTKNGSKVFCRAVNPKVGDAMLEDYYQIFVNFKPELSLRVGPGLDLDDIEEGADVYFECDVEASPKVDRVRWFWGDEELHHNVSSGIIISNRSLVLQQVMRKSSGRYTCRAANSVSSETSVPAHLKVKFSPVCAAGQKQLYGGGTHESMNITCHVDAYPEATVFRWAFNTSTEMYDIPESKTISRLSHSLVAHTPYSQRDFGSLLCWAVNEVGSQQEPCVFHVVPASIPETVKNCSVTTNVSAMGVAVLTCLPGWGGGLHQTFTLEVQKMSSDRVFEVLQGYQQPHFTVSGLEPGTEYIFMVMARNSQGVSLQRTLTFHTPIDKAEKQTSAIVVTNDDFITWSPILGVLIGVAVSILIFVVVITFLVRSHRHAAADNTEVQTASYEYEIPPPQQNLVDEGGFEAEQDPDVICVKQDFMESNIPLRYPLNRQINILSRSIDALPTIQEVSQGTFMTPSSQFYSTEFINCVSPPLHTDIISTTSNVPPGVGHCRTKEKDVCTSSLQPVFSNIMPIGLGHCAISCSNADKEHPASNLQQMFPSNMALGTGPCAVPCGTNKKELPTTSIKPVLPPLNSLQPVNISLAACGNYETSQQLLDPPIELRSSTLPRQGNTVYPPKNKSSNQF